MTKPTSKQTKLFHKEITRGYMSFTFKRHNTTNQILNRHKFFYKNYMTFTCHRF